MWLKDKTALIDACLAGFIPRKPCKVCEKASIDDDCYGRPWCSEHFPAKAESLEDIEEYCFECGEDLEILDCYGRAWCAVHAPGEPLPVVAAEEPTEPVQEAMSNSTNSVCEVEQEPLPAPTEPIVEAVPAPPRLRKERPKTSGMCNTDGCEGIARVFDAMGGQWCPNCMLRRDLVDKMAELGFPRIEFSPAHFVESGEEQCVSFARTMSGTAVSLAVRACARLCAV
jgi:hypothetical protein